MQLEFLDFYSTDQIRLPGLLFTPHTQTKKIALYIHGNGSASIFYSPTKINLFAKSLLEKEIAFFPFNNRGAHYIHKLTQGTKPNEKDIKQGTALELIQDCVFDIDGAINFLKKRGFETFYLIGSSTGANKIVYYNYHNPHNHIKKYVLLSGGDDTGLYYQDMGKEKFIKILILCKDKINRKQGMEFVSEYLGGGLISYQSLFDTINPDGDYNIFPFNEYLNKLHLSKKPLFQEFKSINKDTMIIYGDHDEYCYGNVKKCMDVLKKESSNQKYFTFKLIENADHGFHGKEKKLANLISTWLSGK